MKEIVLCGKETREAVREAIEVGGIEEARRQGLNVDTIKTPEPNEIVEEFVIYENEYQTARIVLDAITAICLSDWLEQLRKLNINDSLTWRFAQQERQAKKNGQRR